MLKKPALSRRMLFGIFTVSGFSGLIYESIWSHYLKLFLGHAAYAQTLVLAIFMGGMALGAWLAARYSLKIRNLLLGYAAVELITGILALIFHNVYSGATSLALDSIIPSIGNASAIHAFKWALGALLILPQSILLGTTFPLISGGVIRRFPEGSGETLAMLYFTNSLGAALGVLASGFVLIGLVGLPGTVMTAGLMNVLLALFVWVMARDQPGNAPASAPVAPAAVSSAPASPVVRIVLFAAFLAGLASFVYEIAWIRMLSLVLGASTHAFELMLSAFILGLALGGFWIRRRIEGFQRPLRVLAVMFALMAALAALTLPAYGFAFEVMSGAMRMFNTTPPGYVGFNMTSHLIAAAMMLPTTIVAGMTLPLMTHYLLRTGSGEQAIGRVYAANTVGAIFGVLLAVHFLLPFVGVKGAIIVGAVFQSVIALLLFRSEAPEGRSVFAMSGIAASVALVALLAVVVKLDPARMASGVYRYGAVSIPSDAKVTFLRDGKTATITLTRQGNIVVISTNGKPDAGVNMGEGAGTTDEITMSVAAALPLAIHPSPKRVANIGVGSGLTSHVVLTSPLVEVLDSIEIEPAMVQAARIGFESRVKNFFHDPRSKIHYEDAKTFFAAANQKYDVIISEPSNPWVSGVASLFSGEFYAHVKRYMAPGALLVQWVQIYETDITVVASIAKALGPNFADYVIYNTDNSNILIVASADGPVPAMRAEVFQGALKDEMHKIGVEDLRDLEVRRIGSKRILEPLFNAYRVPANSDYFPYVDLNAPRMRYLRRTALALTQLNLSAVPVTELLGEPGLAPGEVPTPNQGFFQRQDMVQEALSLRAALVNGDVSTLPPERAKDILTIRTSAPACAQPGVSAAWFQAVAATSARTTPYLAAQDLQPVWQSVESSACFANANAADRTRLNLFKAVAMRDRASIVTLGSALLAETDTLPADARAEILLAVSASLLGLDQPAEAIKLLEADRELVGHREETDLGMRLVDALAASHRGNSPSLVRAE